ncbi:hypothetical protein ABZW47_12640 [Streptomyces sp. NPDC004549]|uniref:hypothetical protein n=1 Tax=Streptomyces sp. NPDC004549 TaxID=3154283 RepID=UPI0033B82725
MAPTVSPSAYCSLHAALVLLFAHTFHEAMSCRPEAVTDDSGGMPVSPAPPTGTKVKRAADFSAN